MPGISRSRRMLPLALILALAALIAPGCRMAPRGQLDECHRLSQTLRSENAQLKDKVLALRSENQDFSDRAVNDGRRLAQLEEAVQRLDSSVQTYQDERSRLESAYRQLRASISDPARPLSFRAGGSAPLGADRSAAGEAADDDPTTDRELLRADGEDEPAAGRSTASEKRPAQASAGWSPARSSGSSRSDEAAGGP